MTISMNISSIDLSAAIIEKPIIMQIAGVGQRGKSAYEIAVEQGYTGTEAEWIASLVGPDGPQGADGKDGYTPVKGVDYFDGDTGPQGPAGADGKDGYTPVKGVDYFDGETGPQGPTGADGYTPVKGVDYFDGDTGPQGPAGVDGADGQGVPTGGTAGQILQKKSDDDFDSEWVDISSCPGAVDDYVANTYITTYLQSVTGTVSNYAANEINVVPIIIKKRCYVKGVAFKTMNTASSEKAVVGIYRSSTLGIGEFLAQSAEISGLPSGYAAVVGTFEPVLCEPGVYYAVIHTDSAATPLYGINATMLPLFWASNYAVLSGNMAGRYGTPVLSRAYNSALPSNLGELLQFGTASLKTIAPTLALLIG